MSNTGTIVDAKVIDLSGRGGDVTSALLDAAGTWQASLLVVGTRQHHGFLAWLEGAISEPLARLCRCAILVVPASYEREVDQGPQRILFAVDGSAPSQRALQCGVQFARSQTLLRVVHVLDQPVDMGDFVPIPLFEDVLVKKGEAALAAAGTTLARLRITAEPAMISTDRTKRRCAQCNREGSRSLARGSGRNGYARSAWPLALATRQRSEPRATHYASARATGPPGRWLKYPVNPATWRAVWQPRPVRKGPMKPNALMPPSTRNRTSRKGTCTALLISMGRSRLSTQFRRHNRGPMLAGVLPFAIGPMPTGTQTNGAKNGIIAASMVTIRPLARTARHRPELKFSQR